MPAKQKTIKYSVSCTGVGLHTGVQSTVTFHPADENTGIKFIRNDKGDKVVTCLLYTSPSPRDATLSRMPSSA